MERGRLAPGRHQQLVCERLLQGRRRQKPQPVLLSDSATAQLNNHNRAAPAQHSTQPNPPVSRPILTDSCTSSCSCFWRFCTCSGVRGVCWPPNVVLLLEAEVAEARQLTLQVCCLLLRCCCLLAGGARWAAPLLLCMSRMVLYCMYVCVEKLMQQAPSVATAVADRLSQPHTKQQQTKDVPMQPVQ